MSDIFIVVAMTSGIFFAVYNLSSWQIQTFSGEKRHRISKIIVSGYEFTATVVAAVSARIAVQSRTFFRSRHVNDTGKDNIPKVLSVLDLFKWFCGKENREHVVLIKTDLISDAEHMRGENRSTVFIVLVLSYHIAIGTILPIVWDAAIRMLEKLARAAKLVRSIRS